MRTLLIALAVAAAFVTGSTAGAADYELKGFTTATFQGNQTVRGFTEACQAEFSADTRMCNSIEVIQTVNWPSLPADTSAWTHPVLAPNPQDTNILDQAGGVVFPVTDVGYLSCSSWTSVANDRFGAVAWSEAPFLSSGTLHIAAWNCEATLPVACCGPVPAPAMAVVPSILWFGRGLLAALMLSLAGGALLFRGRPLLTDGARDISLRR